MNCRALARVLPELAAGELDEKRAAEAREHIAACSACAEELEEYQQALGALTACREMASVPEALNILDLPEKTRRSWARPAPASMGAAILLLAIVLMLPLFLSRKPETPSRTTVRPVAPKVVIAHEPVALQPKPESRPVRHKRYITRARHTHFIARRPTERAKDLEPSPVIVMVSQMKLPPESYVVQIESTDTESGTTSVYAQLHDEAMGDQTVGITSNLNAEDNGRI